MNNSTNTTGEELPVPNEAEKIFKVVFYVILFIIGTIGNFLVVIIVKAKNRHRTVNDYFILNLAISDLTFLCFALPFYYYELFERFPKFEFYCKFVWPMMSITLLVSINTLTLMAVERCRAILFPFRPRIKKPTLFIGIVAVWAWSLLIMVPLMIVAEPVSDLCMEYWSKEAHRKAYTAVLFVLQFALPITVIVVAYIAIIITLVKTKVPNRTSVNHRGQLVKQKSRSDNLHVIRTVAIIVVLFLICMLPNQIAWILMDFGGKQYEHLSNKFWLLAEALIFFHSCVNPIIYGSLTRQYRDGYIQYLRYFCCCCKHYIPNGIDLTAQQHNNTRSRMAGKLAYRGSLKSPSSVNGMKTSCQGPTVITSCRYGSTRSPPSSARSTPSSKRFSSSPSRLSSVRPQLPSPLIINNKKAFLDTKIPSAVIEDGHEDKRVCKDCRLTTANEKFDIEKEIPRETEYISCSRKQQTTIKNGSSLRTNLKENNDDNESTILENRAAHEIDKTIPQIHNNYYSENHDGTFGKPSRSAVSQSEPSSISVKIDESIPKKSSVDRGCSSQSAVECGIDDDEPTVQDTYL